MTGVEAAGTEEPIQSTCIDTSILESDDSDGDWTDVSSHSDFSDSAASDSADSCGCSDRKGVGGKKHGHSSSSLLTCGGEKLVRTT